MEDVAGNVTSNRVAITLHSCILHSMMLWHVSCYLQSE